MRRQVALLGPDGRPFPRKRPIDLAAHYDVAWTSNQNEQHWSLATGGDANIAFDYTRRYKSRQRARYETANNPHLRGMVETRAYDTIGTGPQLQILTDSGQEIEAHWNSWAQEIDLVDKLFTLWCAGKLTDGEGNALIVENQFLESVVPLDLLLFEPEQMGNPYAQADTESLYDGVQHFGGRPYRYYIYDNNPESYSFVPSAGVYSGQWYETSRVIHCFKRYRSGQLRGATEIGPALPLAAILRRYTLATLDAAEAAASISLWLETDGSPEEGPQEYDGGAFQSFPVTRNLVITAPYGWHAKQIKAEQPASLYDSVKRSIVVEMGRAIGLPAAISAGDSSDYNMASGRLDFQTYIRSIKSDRARHLEPGCLEKIFITWMKYYLGTKSGIGPSNIDAIYIRDNYPHRWSYQPINHSDPEKQAAADIALWEKGLLTDDDLLYERGKDPETHYQQLQQEVEIRKNLGMPLPGAMPGLNPSTEEVPSE